MYPFDVVKTNLQNKEEDDGEKVGLIDMAIYLKDTYGYGTTPFFLSHPFSYLKSISASFFVHESISASFLVSEISFSASFLVSEHHSIFMLIRQSPNSFRCFL